jgi:hypothetical protein
MRTPRAIQAVSSVLGLPFANSLIGLIEIVPGIDFARIADRFDRGGFYVKLGLSIVVFSNASRSAY